MRLRRALAAFVVGAVLMGASWQCEPSSGPLQGPLSPVRDEPGRDVGGNTRSEEGRCRELKEAADNAPVLNRAKEMLRYRKECL